MDVWTLLVLSSTCTSNFNKSLMVADCSLVQKTNLVLTLSVPHFFWLWQKWVYQSVRHHTGLTHPLYFFDIRTLWRPVLSARVSECQKIEGWVRPVWPWTFWSVTIWQHWAWKGQPAHLKCQRVFTCRQHTADRKDTRHQFSDRGFDIQLTAP